MKTILRYLLSGTMMMGVLMLIPACRTSDPGIKSSYARQWATLPGDTVKVTNAAKEALEDLKLKKIEAQSTGVDGHVVGYESDETTRVNINIERAGPNTSDVSVSVGALGDPSLGKEILAAIQKKVGG